MKQKYWEVLLIEWRKKGHNGFSIPFVIGAQQYSRGLAVRHDISDLIWDIALNDSTHIYITYCTDIKDLILGVRDESKIRIAGKYLSLSTGVTSSLFLTKIAYNLGDSIDEVIVNLIENYQSHIDKEEYSINDGERGMFTLSEREFIESCLS